MSHPFAVSEKVAGRALRIPPIRAAPHSQTARWKAGCSSSRIHRATRPAPQLAQYAGRGHASPQAARTGGTDASSGQSSPERLVQEAVVGAPRRPSRHARFAPPADGSQKTDWSRASHARQWITTCQIPDRNLTGLGVKGGTMAEEHICEPCDGGWGHEISVGGDDTCRVGCFSCHESLDFDPHSDSSCCGHRYVGEYLYQSEEYAWTWSCMLCSGSYGEHESGCGFSNELGDEEEDASDVQ
jgi:hypothetical protein